MPIFARISINRQRAEFGIHKSIHPGEWDNHRGRASGTSRNSRELNFHLDTIMSELLQKKQEIERDGRQLTALNLKDAYQGVEQKSTSIMEVFQNHNERCKGLINKDFAPGTVERYNTCYKHVKDFIRIKYKREDMDLNDISPNFICNLEYYLKTNRECCHNTAVKYIKNFKKIIRIALANVWMKSDPFTNIRYKLDDVDMNYLNEEELNTLMNKEFKIERL